jgi:hypothetical protein
MMLVFDVGETLASEERWPDSWADRLAVPRSSFFATLGRCSGSKDGSDGKPPAASPSARQ